MRWSVVQAGLDTELVAFRIDHHDPQPEIALRWISSSLG